jgi:uncharacterized low-complexity protein
MKTSNKTLALAVSGAFALSISAASIQAAENPFAIKSLSSGYQVADAGTDAKMKDGKCATGKCGANKKKAMENEMKAKEGNCSAEMKAKEGNCSAETKAKEGNCSADMKMKDGSCSAEMKAKAGVSDTTK